MKTFQLRPSGSAAEERNCPTNYQVRTIMTQEGECAAMSTAVQAQNMNYDKIDNLLTHMTLVSDPAKAMREVAKKMASLRAQSTPQSDREGGFDTSVLPEVSSPDQCVSYVCSTQAEEAMAAASVSVRSVDGAEMLLLARTPVLTALAADSTLQDQSIEDDIDSEDQPIAESLTKDLRLKVRLVQYISV